MGASGETATPPAATKAPKTSSAAPATPAASAAAAAAAAVSTTSPTSVQDPQAAGYNEWLAALQAYYQAGAQPPPGGFPHPYMWGGQPMMPPPYGGPHPSYGAMYPPGGMYAHPMYGQYGAPASEAMAGVEQADGKPTPEAKAGGDGAKPTSLKRSKGSKGSLQLLKVGEGTGKGNGVSQSSNGDDNENDGETGSDGSTDNSREENAQNLLGGKRSFGEMAIDAGAAPYMPPPGAVPGPPPPVGPPGSGGSLDMSLDYWSAGSVPQPKGGKRASGSPSTSAPPAELWLTDEREVKRQRRKQSNRESARRSRLRKQAECEELGTRVDTLTVENIALRTELSRVTEECKRLQAENSSLVLKIRTTPSSDTAAAADSAAAAAPAAETEGPVFGKESEEVQGNANGNVKVKEDKSAVNGDAGIKAQDEQGAAA